MSSALKRSRKCQTCIRIWGNCFDQHWFFRKIIVTSAVLNVEKRKSLSRHKNFRLINSLVSSNIAFTKFFTLCPAATVWKTEKYSLSIVWQKFCESKVFTEELMYWIVDFTKEILVRENFSFFHTALLPHSMEISPNHSHAQFFVKPFF